VLDGEAIALRPDDAPRPFRTRCAASGASWTTTRCRQIADHDVFDAHVAASAIDRPLTRRVGVSRRA
jgi:hypothetical protein